MSDRWVDVVFMQGDDYNGVSDLGIDEMAAHMAQWDYGHDTDFAHTRHGAPWGPADRLYEVNLDGLDYVLTVISRRCVRGGSHGEAPPHGYGRGARPWTGGCPRRRWRGGPAPAAHSCAIRCRCSAPARLCE